MSDKEGCREKKTSTEWLRSRTNDSKRIILEKALIWHMSYNEYNPTSYRKYMTQQRSKTIAMRESLTFLYGFPP